MPKRKAQTAVPAVPNAALGTRIKKDIIKNYQLYLLMIPGFLLLILFKIGPVGAMVIALEDISAAKSSRNQQADHQHRYCDHNCPKQTTSDPILRE